MHRVECLGDLCPLPLMKLLQCREQLSHGEHVMMVTDHSCTCQSILSYCQKQNYHTLINEPIPGIWEITVFQDTNA